MARKLPFIIDAAALGLASISYDSIDRDWSEMHNPSTGEPGWQAVLPSLPLSEVDDRARDLWEDFPEEKARFDADPTARVDDDSDLFDAFWQSDGADEWRDSFDPMMNYGWPVYLGYQPDLKAIATRIDQMGIACSLIEISGGEFGEETYEIALTGGGMNLGDHLFAAYLACGQVPPLALLENLGGCLPSSLLPALPVAPIMERARSWLRSQAANLERVETNILESAIREADREAERAQGG
jgi:hypothetical protein